MDNVHILKFGTWSMYILDQSQVGSFENCVYCARSQVTSTWTKLFINLQICIPYEDLRMAVLHILLGSRKSLLALNICLQRHPLIVWKDKKWNRFITETVSLSYIHWVEVQGLNYLLSITLHWTYAESTIFDLILALL